jgi:transposase
MMKAAEKNSALVGIKKEQLKRRVFTVQFKAEVVRHKKAENISNADCARKFDVLPKLIQHWEKQYDAGQLTVAAGRRAVSPEQEEITRLRAELSRTKMEVSILKKATVYFAKESQ